MVIFPFGMQAQVYADKYGAEVVLGMHSRTEKKKSWKLYAFGPRMKGFIEKTLIGKKIQTDLQAMSDSWGLV